MQKKYGFAPLGSADGPVKTAIFGGNNAKLYGINSKKAMLDFKSDKFTILKADYEKDGPGRSNMRYGYVVPIGAVDYSSFA
jgi:uncharacterized protein